MKKFDMDEQTSNKELLGMTHYVDLPTGGKFYPEDHPWHGHSSVEIKMLTTREEEILTNQSYIEKSVVVDKLLESILIPSVPSDLIFDQDKMAILIAARVEAYGPDYEVELQCGSCETKLEAVVDLNPIVESRIIPEYEITDKGTVIFEAPKSKKVIEFRHLLPKELDSIQKTVERMSTVGIKTTDTLEIYKRVIASVDGNDKPEAIASFVENLRILDSRKLLSVYGSSLPSLDLSFNYECGSCAHQGKGGLPIQANFFFPEL